LVLDGTSFTDIDHYGVNASPSSGSVRLTGTNVFSNVRGAPLRVHPQHARGLNSASEYSGNTDDHIELTAGALGAGAHSWSPLDVPYRLPENNHVTWYEGATLTIEAGAVVEGAPQSHLYAQGGGLDVAGTETNPVIFRGAEATPGYWAGIHVLDPDVSEATHRVTWARFSDAGGSGSAGFATPWGAIVVGNRVELTVTNTSFANIAATCAIHGPGYGDTFAVTGCSVVDGTATLLCDPD